MAVSSRNILPCFYTLPCFSFSLLPSPSPLRFQLTQAWSNFSISYLSSVKGTVTNAGLALFCACMDRDGVEIHKHEKKGTRPISSHLTSNRTRLVNKELITWLSGKFISLDTAVSSSAAER